MVSTLTNTDWLSWIERLLQDPPRPAESLEPRFVCHLKEQPDTWFLSTVFGARGSDMLPGVHSS